MRGRNTVTVHLMMMVRRRRRHGGRRKVRGRMLVGTDWVHVARVTTRSTSIVHHLRMIRCPIHLILLEEEGGRGRERDRTKRKGGREAIKREGETERREREKKER